MASRILGIDIGTHAVKVLIATPGLRQATPAMFVERPIPPPEPFPGTESGTDASAEAGTSAEASTGDDEGSLFGRALGVLAELAIEYSFSSSDVVYLAVPSAHLFHHVIEFPFRSLRRQDLEKAVGAELEGILPIDLEDMVYGFEQIPDIAALTGATPGEPSAIAGPAPVRPTRTGSRAGTSSGVMPSAAFEAAADDEGPTQVRTAPQPKALPGPVAAPTEGMRTLACALEITRAASLIERLSAVGLEPRALIAAPAYYARIAQQAGHTSAPIAVIDIGHTYTQICVVIGDKPVYVRSLLRGGKQVTAAIAKAWKMSELEAETAKHSDGFVASRAEPATSEAWQRIHEVVVTEAMPLAREIKRTLTSCRAKTGITATAAFLVGGGSRLRGLSSYMSEKLRMPVFAPGNEEADRVFGAKLGQSGDVALDVGASAAGAALEGGTGRPRFDLRQGDLAFKADLSVLRKQAPAVAIAVLVVMAFATLNGFASLYRLRAEEEHLTRRLALETTALFGEQLDAEATMARIQGKGGGSKSPLPKMTAYDILLEMNGSLPDKDKVTLDVQNVDIKPGKIIFRATSKSSTEIDAVEEALQKVECFREITRGATSVSSNNAREFSFTINTNCS